MISRNTALGLAIMTGLTGAAFARPTFRTQLDTTNFCAKGNRVELKIFMDDNNDAIDQAQFVIEYPAADFNLDSADSSPHDGNIRVEELDDDGDEGRIEVTVTWGLGDDDFEEGLLVSLDFIVQQDITGTTRFQLENEKLNTEEDNDEDVDVNTSATEPLTCSTTTPTPTPTPVPTPAPGETIYSTTFDGTDTPWQPVQITGGPFDPVLFSASTGSIGISPDGSANAFGFYRSPVISVTGGHRLEIDWRVRSTSDETLTPAFRLRTTDGQFRYTNFLAIESPVGGVAPGTSERIYQAIYDVPVDASAIELAFDLTSFNPDDDLDATVELLDVTVRRQ